MARAPLARVCSHTADTCDSHPMTHALKTGRELSQAECNAQLRLQPVSLTWTLSESHDPVGVSTDSVTISCGWTDLRMRDSEVLTLRLWGREWVGPGLWGPSWVIPVCHSLKFYFSF